MSDETRVELYMQIAETLIATLTARLQEAERQLRDHAESEAAICPEDVGCIEYITVLKRKLTEAKRTCDCLRREGGSLAELAHDLEYKNAALNGRAEDAEPQLREAYRIECHYTQVQIEGLAKKMGLDLPSHGFTPRQAVSLEIGRLMGVQRMWEQACDLARTHCPVGDGESHIRDGIPRLAKRAEKAEAELDAVSQVICGHDQFDGDLAQYVRNAVEGLALAEREVGRLRERLQFDPGGSDQIDELEQALQFVRHSEKLSAARAEKAEAERDEARKMWLNSTSGNSELVTFATLRRRGVEKGWGDLYPEEAPR